MRYRRAQIIPLSLATAVAAVLTASTGAATAETSADVRTDSATRSDPRPSASGQPFMVDSKGGYKECPAGKRIRVRVDYRRSSESDRTRVRIYQSPSKRTKRDIQKDMPITGEMTNTVFISGRIRVGYWNVRSTPDRAIINQFTYASCVG